MNISAVPFRTASRTLGIAGACLFWSLGALAQTKDPEPPATLKHPWGSFKPGAWVKLADTLDLIPGDTPSERTLTLVKIDAGFACVKQEAHGKETEAKHAVKDVPTFLWRQWRHVDLDSLREAVLKEKCRWEATAAKKPPVAKVKPVPGVKELLAQLGSEDFDVREKAETALVEIGPGALPQVGEKLESASDPEVKQRCRRVMERLGFIPEEQRSLTIEGKAWKCLVIQYDVIVPAGTGPAKPLGGVTMWIHPDFPVPLRMISRLQTEKRQDDTTVTATKLAAKLKVGGKDLSCLVFEQKLDALDLAGEGEFWLCAEVPGYKVKSEMRLTPKLQGAITVTSRTVGVQFGVK